MMDLSLKEHDLEIVDGDVVLCRTDREAIAQAIMMRLKTIAGEWFMDTNLGIPYLTEIFGRMRSVRFLRQMLVPLIVSVAGVKEVKDFSIDEDHQRRVKITFTAILNNHQQISINESIGL